MTPGQSVRLINLDGVPESKAKLFTVGNIYTIKSINPNTGGIRVEEVYIGENIEGIEQGLRSERFEPV